MKNKPTDRQDPDTLLHNDRVFRANYRRIRSVFTSGLIPAAQFNRIVEWQIGDCFRRKGLPLRQARIMQRATACRLTSV